MSSVLRFCWGFSQGGQEVGQVFVLQGGGARQGEGGRLLLAPEGPKGNKRRS